MHAPSAGLGLVLGCVLYFLPSLRANLIAWAGGSLWWLGSIADLVTFACIAAFVVAAAMAHLPDRAHGFRKTNHPGSGIAARLSTDFGREFPIALLVIAIALPLLITGASQRYAIDTATQILIYIMLGWGLNVVVGLAGLLDLGYVAFYAVGAYTYALISTEFGWSFWVCLPLAGMLAALWGITLGFPVLRLRGDYLAIVTLAFGEIIRIVILNWQSLTGGPNGINRIPKLDLFRPLVRQGCAAELSRLFRAGVQSRLSHHFPLLRHPRSGARDQLCDAAPAPAAHRAGLGSLARG